MTFAEYNTDENFNKPSNAMELVRLGKEEGKTREEIADSLSPLWKEDKKGNVKKALDYHFNTETTPKAEETVTEKVTETAPQEEETKLNKSDSNFLNNQFAIVDEAKRKVINDAVNEKVGAFNNTLDSLEKMGAAYKNVDDHFLEQLPTFIYRRYQNGEFGDITDTSTPEGKEAKKNAQLRMAHFMINGIGTALSNVSNVIKGKQLEDSDYEKYQKSNLEQGMANRWSKYKVEMNNAMTMLANRGYKEEAIADAAREISQNQNLQNAFNMADENKKLYMLEVVTKLGDKIGNMNDKKYVNLMLGMAASKDIDPTQAAEMLAIRAGGSLANKYNLFDANGNIDLSVIKNLVSTLGKDTTGKLLNEYGIDINNINFENASIDNTSDDKTNDKPELPGSQFLSKPVIGNTYNGDTSREGNFLGAKMGDKVMKLYTSLQSEKPEGIKTDLVSDETLTQFLNDNPDMKAGDVLNKSGVLTAIDNQSKEIKQALSQAEKDYKNNKDLETYKARVKELDDYFSKLEDITKKFGYANYLINYEGIHKTAKKVNKKK